MKDNCAKFRIDQFFLQKIAKSHFLECLQLPNQGRLPFFGGLLITKSYLSKNTVLVKFFVASAYI